MNYSEEEEGRQQQDVAKWWHGSDSDVDRLNYGVGILRNRMWTSEEIARHHFAFVREIADSGLPVADAHLAIMDCYRRGHGVDRNPDRALHYLKKAMQTGSESAWWFYGTFLVRTDGFEGVLEPDPEEALNIFKRLMRGGNITTQSLARSSAASLLITGKRSGQLPTDDENIVRQYFSDRAEISPHHYADLALFYAAEPTREKAMTLLIEGLTARSEMVRQRCQELLEEWGAMPVPTPQPTGAQRAIKGVKTAAGLGYILVVMLVWSGIGLTLLAITSWISLFIGLPILVAIIIFGGISAFRRR